MKAKARMKRSKNFIATVEEDKIKNIQSIAKYMQADGVKINQILSISGIITGSANDLSDLNKYKGKGIKTIEEEKQVKAL